MSADKPATSRPFVRKRAGARRSNPFRFDRHLLAERVPDGAVLAGADEVGRGCLAGPLVAAAVTLDYRRTPERLLVGLSDSKALSAAARADLYPRLLMAVGRISLVAVCPRTIDEAGLHRSNLAALARALEGLGGQYDLALVDGFALSRPDLRVETIPDADWRSAAVAAASVVAKVARDRLMCRLADLHPHYGFEEHVGYATRGHRAALAEHGVSALHRRSFATVASLLESAPAERDGSR